MGGPGREFAGPAWLLVLEQTGIAQTMRESLWAYPIVEIIHIIGFVMLVGAATMFDLRVLGISRNIEITQLARHLLPWSVLSLLLVVPAGLLMFSTHATEFAANPAFLLKLSLIALAGANAAAFHVGPYRYVERWNRNLTAPGAARFFAGVSIVIWLAVISCGRLLAYL
ncbi:MAG: DUF6644 family protein [Burkholderiales bacterium]|nr:hypothetical protein [Burkholderiales bacterium]MDQ3196200.1 hypothetical protein [Pseudomonadota bacterium]